MPDDWVTFRDLPAGLAGYRRQVGVIRIPKNAEKDFVLASAILPDNSLLQVGRSSNSREAILEPVRRSFIIVGGVTVLLGFAAGAFFAHRAMRPVRQIVATARSDHPHGQAGRARARAPRRRTNWTNWSACSTPCSTRTRR